MTNRMFIKQKTFVRLGSLSVLLATLAIPLAAGAKPSSTSTAVRPSAYGESVVPLPSGRVLADNVVVTPGGAPAPAQAPAQPNQTVVVPQSAPAPAATQQTVVDPPAKQKHVHAEVSGPRNYMSTIAISALMGGLTGGLVGGAIYFLGDNENARNIAYWAAGGVLVGGAVGVTQVVVQESRVSSATASRFPSDPAPTYRVALLRLRF